MHVYASRDLYNWSDAGIALAVSDDPQSPIARGCILERPKVVFNPHTKKFVMWFHLEPKDAGYSGSLSGVAAGSRMRSSSQPATMASSGWARKAVW